MGGRKLKVKMAIDRDEYYGYQYFDGCECCLGRGGYTPRRPPLEFDMSFDLKTPALFPTQSDSILIVLIDLTEVEAEKVVTVTDAECLIAITRIAFDKRTDGGSAVLPLRDKIKY
ncbi:hypothetical protein F2Q68_00007570 [Brassica cretica]|uniref:Uncharacterized protein n=1 Tax=Brassica cretica TaxID=69181 RepID=A0A8S9L3R3_BRACR|nr:hypothetical protein F2Q68_00007570 [Brassica cretica]